MANKSKAAEAEVRYSKEQFMKFKAYAGKKVLLSVLLKNGETYTTAEVKALLNNYLKGVVK